MLLDLLTLRIDKSSFLVPLDVLAAVLCVVLLVRRPGGRLIRSLIACALGAAIGLLVCWLVTDVWNVFGLPLTQITWMWATLAFAGIALALANLRGSRPWRKVVAIVSIAVFALTAAAGINVDFGAYRNLKDALGLTPYPAMSAAYLHGHESAMAPALGATWQPPSGMPSKGRVGTVRIPATKSGFGARIASVYLPPAALVASPPALPVAVLFSGQPGAPSDVFTAGRVAQMLNAYAHAHKGLAPIVVAPDQLGRPDKNPMCVDSPLGKSATYLLVDVPNWIRSHLNVAADPRYWAVGGYSQGGTCSIQFGAGHPDLFRSIIDISGEEAPTIGPSTVREAFGGSAAAYKKITPLALLAAHRPYPDTLAIFGVGANDAKYNRIEHTMVTAAHAAGMTTRFIESPNTAHDWNTVRYVLKRALPQVADSMGLGG
ncbi:alpha/beta hydrolase-fold protein [Microbacterium sp. STN6]|uniref:alpha/beta hydrolase n=1 Tax=Microbacterium sp. STN6 TaxID=2995588 RepID=UPI00226087DC|nr:alpha/beta hydrolase-fold protein [Microbacterium sp. STN6]MCX7522909.1 alpha/beta hydrolase-fold protein [Microbacterium sp. STN6]